MQQWNLEQPDNLVEMFENTVKKFPDRPFLGTKNKPQGRYDWITYGELGARVDALRAGLARLGVGRGDTVGIIANNRIEWAIAHFATLGLNACWVPMYEAELPATWEYIVRDSAMKALFVSSPAVMAKVKDFPSRIPSLAHLILIDGQGAGSMVALEATGKKAPVPSVRPAPEDVAVLIYTSGTTGDPKGVLLMHMSWTSNSHARLKVLNNLSEHDRTLSILPWAHCFGLGELHSLMHLGGSVGFCEGPTSVLEDLGLVQPTFMLAVPRIFNRVYDSLWKKMAEAGGVKQKLFLMGVNAAKQKRALNEAGQSDFATDLKLALANRLVFAKIRKLFGGRLKGVLTGSAAMNPDISRFFFDIGVPLYDAYGLTETVPGITMNGPNKFRIGSVGVVLDKVKVVIDSSVVEPGAKDGEIICYGPNVMKGYHNKPEATREVLMPDGGLRTGDRGRLDADGFLWITGRIKEQYKLENGKYVFPAGLEEAISLNSLVQSCLVYGDGRPYNVCLVVPDPVTLEGYASKNGWPKEPKAMLARDDVRAALSEELKNSLKGKFGGYEIPQKFLFVTDPFTVENGMLTQTLKLKRKVILNQYLAQMEALYQ